MNTRFAFPNLPRFLLIWLASLVALFNLLQPASAQAPDEFRGLWVYGFGNDFHTPEKVTELIANARAANLNALVVQVRVRGDALYNSNYEPKRTSIDPDFDPLADLIAKGHDTSGGKQKIEIHAWIVTYHIWNSANPPPQPDHPYNLHPDWLLKDIDGNVHQTFDPGHPSVQEHTYNVAMDIITNYDVDGLNFDYIRYSGTHEGYNEVSVARFNELYGRTGIPQPDDADWKQFRRDQITGLLRKIYLNAIAVRPEVKISADTITWGHQGVSTIEEWPSSSAYAGVLQDWRGWMEEGILDLNIPMNYYREHNNTDPDHAQAYRNWSTFAKNHKYNRHLAIGPGIYLNTLSNAIAQMRHTRVPTESGNTAEGVCGYVYHVTNNEGRPFSEFRKALTEPSVYDPISPPMFAEKADIPEMPWKTNPTTGHLMGYVRDGATNEPLDGAWVHLSGDLERVIKTDPTGFYGFVDLPPGNYTVHAAWDGDENPAVPLSISVGTVSEVNLNFEMPPPTTGDLEGTARNATTNQPVSGATVHLSGPATGTAETNTAGFYRFPDLPPGNYTVSASWEESVDDAPATKISIAVGQTTSQDLNFAVSGGGAPGAEVIVDDLDSGATFIGPDWRSGSFSTGYETNYRFTHNAGHFEYEGYHAAIFLPTLPEAGLYKIDTWYPAGGNRAPDAPYTVSDGENTLIVPVDQQSNGSQWFTVVDALYLDPAKGPFVIIDNGGTNLVTMADAVRWTALEPIDPEYTITTLIDGEGRIEGLPEEGIAGHGADLALEGIGENGYVFSHWNGKNAWGSDNPLGVEVGSNLEIGAVFVSPWLNWVEANFTESERAEPDFSAPHADPFGHGISNLLKFALGLDLRDPDRNHLPRVTTGEDGIELTFRRLQETSGVNYLVEYSSDLGTWNSDPEQIEEVSVTPNDDETETVTVRVSTNSEERMFIRLLVEQN